MEKSQISRQKPNCSGIFLMLCSPKDTQASWNNLQKIRWNIKRCITVVLTSLTFLTDQRFKKSI